MQVDVVLLPSQLATVDLTNRAVVIFDVLRATTSMTAALAVGVDRIFLFGSTGAVRAARKEQGFLDAILCGEERCKRPADFQLGNSPIAFNASSHCGKTLMMATTNGTGAILASKGAAHRFVGAVVNASAVARRLHEVGADITLVCAGTGGQVAGEDLIGAGAVISALLSISPQAGLKSDRAWIAHQLFLSSREHLKKSFSSTLGGRNVIEAGLESDIEFAARLDALDVVGEVVQLANDDIPFVTRGLRR